jgi:hypothetical protein
MIDALSQDLRYALRQFYTCALCGQYRSDGSPDRGILRPAIAEITSRPGHPTRSGFGNSSRRPRPNAARTSRSSLAVYALWFRAASPTINAKKKSSGTWNRTFLSSRDRPFHGARSRMGRTLQPLSVATVID